MSNQALSGQVAVVTGAAHGIGLSIAHKIAAAGAKVVLTDLHEAPITRAADEVRARNEGAEVVSFFGDLSQESVVAELRALTESSFGPATILVNNAGITRDNLAMRMKDSEWDAVIDTNLKAVFRMSKLVMRGMMKARTGRIINITSVVGSSGNAGQANYAAAKAGVAGLTRALAQELGSRNITVNCVAPGFIDTDMTKELPEAQREALQGKIALGRLGKPEEIAAVVGFLASPAATYVTGATLHVNGGMYMA